MSMVERFFRWIIRKMSALRLNNRVNCADWAA